MVAGTRIVRTIVASRKTETARPTPICWNIGIWPRAKPLNTATMMAAAPVMMFAVRRRPNATDSVLSWVSSNRSRIRLSRKMW